MKILVFAHSGHSGGAEHALRHLVGLLRHRHEVHVVLPAVDGGEAAYYTAAGVPCFHLPLPMTLPHFSAAMLQLAQWDLEQIAGTLRGHGFDIAISNTVAILHGGLLAALLQIPHLVYAHEYLADDELLPVAIPPAAYLRHIEDLSCAVVSCSRFVSGQFRAERRAALEVLAPFDFAAEPIPRGPVTEPERVIQVIGAQSRRKNVALAVTVAKALALRGVAVRLDIIGAAASGAAKLARSLEKRKIPYRLLPHCADPCAVNLAAQVVTLVCSVTEPYGLTVPESLRLGVPVLATRSGGPSEILPDHLLHDTGDLDECVRKLERIFADYPGAVGEAEAIYRQLQGAAPTGDLRDGLEATLQAALARFAAPPAPAPIFDWIERLKSVLAPGIAPEQIAANIAAVEGTDESGTAAMIARIALEKEQPGLATGQDIRAFDVVPFANSRQMDALYTHGLGLAVELASTCDDPGRLQMAAFIVCALSGMRQSLSRPLKVLALGDGIGIDTLRLARAGFSVDYMDYDRSNMSAIAARNLASAQAISDRALDITVVEKVERAYDAVVCLEVIEHVPAPVAFADVLFNALSENGILFISECFNGIENRWPTHLLPNESYAGLLPVVLLGHFAYRGANRTPYAKPYMFSRRREKQPSQALDLLLDPGFMTYLVMHQSDIGI